MDLGYKHFSFEYYWISITLNNEKKFLTWLLELKEKFSSQNTSVLNPRSPEVKCRNHYLLKMYHLKLFAFL